MTPRGSSLARARRGSHAGLSSAGGWSARRPLLPFGVDAAQDRAGDQVAGGRTKHGERRLEPSDGMRKPAAHTCPDRETQEGHVAGPRLAWRRLHVPDRRRCAAAGHAAFEGRSGAYSRPCSEAFDSGGRRPNKRHQRLGAVTSASTCVKPPLVCRTMVYDVTLTPYRLWKSRETVARSRSDAVDTQPRRVAASPLTAEG